VLGKGERILSKGPPWSSLCKTSTRVRPSVSSLLGVDDQTTEGRMLIPTGGTKRGESVVHMAKNRARNVKAASSHHRVVWIQSDHHSFLAIWQEEQIKVRKGDPQQQNNDNEGKSPSKGALT
jgi:hypothetical protein